jgi:hypothetical protein
MTWHFHWFVVDMCLACWYLFCLQEVLLSISSISLLKFRATKRFITIVKPLHGFLAIIVYACLKHCLENAVLEAYLRSIPVWWWTSTSCSVTQDDQKPACLCKTTSAGIGRKSKVHVHAVSRWHPWFVRDSPPYTNSSALNRILAAFELLLYTFIVYLHRSLIRPYVSQYCNASYFAWVS